MSLILMACNISGVVKFDPVTEEFTKVEEITGSAWSVLCDRHGKIWISTVTDGIIIHDPKTGKKDFFGYDRANPRSLSHNHVHYTYQDEADQDLDRCR